MRKRERRRGRERGRGRARRRGSESEKGRKYGNEPVGDATKKEIVEGKRQSDTAQQIAPRLVGREQGLEDVGVEFADGIAHEHEQRGRGKRRELPQAIKEAEVEHGDVATGIAHRAWESQDHAFAEFLYVSECEYA